MLPLSLPTPSSSSFSSFPLLLSKIENRTAGNWRSLSLLWPSGFAMPFSSSPDNFLVLFLFAFFSLFLLLLLHKLHKPLFLKLDFHLRRTRSTRRVYAAFLPSILLSLFFTSFQPVLSSRELSSLGPARTGAPFSSWRRFKEKKKNYSAVWSQSLFGRRRNGEDPDQVDCVPEGTGRSDLVQTSADRRETLVCIKNTFVIMSEMSTVTLIHTLYERRLVLLSDSGKMANKKFHQVEPKNLHF